MNLVIDDAVEVKQATKTNEEKRKELGTRALLNTASSQQANTGKQARFCSKEITWP